MKAIKLSIAIALLTTLIFSSCSKDDGDTPIAPSASDIISTIDENPDSGASIGIVATNLTGNLSFSITSQSVSNAFSIDNATGAVTVNDALKFDFETNPSLTASVNVSNGAEAAIANIDVSLNDVDDIASFLSTSQADYNAASNGEWIIITEAEYNALATNLNQVTKSATADSEYNGNATLETGGANFTLINTNGIVMPNNSYVFAFKYNSIGNNVTETRVKQSSTNASNGFSTLGNDLPMHNTGNNYFVLKGSNTPTTATGYLAIYESNGVFLKRYTGNTYNFEAGDSNSITGNSSSGATWQYQGLSSTQKQWN